MKKERMQMRAMSTFLTTTSDLEIDNWKWEPVSRHEYVMKQQCKTSCGAGRSRLRSKKGHSMLHGHGRM